MTSRGLVEMPSAAKVPSPETAPDLRAARAATLVGEMRAWALLATAALAIAGIFAFLLAVSRLPGIEATGVWPLGFFTKGLVIHVVFSLVVWFLAVFALMATDAAYEASRGTPRLAALGSAGTGLVAIAMPLLFLPAFLDDTVATLNNYVPVIVHRAYYLGLTLLALGVALPGARLLASLERPRGDASPYVLALSAGAIVYFAALACVALSLLYSWGGEPNRIFHEHLFWGGGHVLQFLNTLMLLTGWHLLVSMTSGGRRPDPDIFRIGVLLIAVLAAGTPLLYVVLEPFSFLWIEAFRRLQMVVAFPSMLIALSGLGVVMAARRARETDFRDPVSLSLALSVVLFAAGGLMGLVITGSDTRTPAHYHSMIAAVNLALMGLFFGRFLPALTEWQPGTRLVRTQIALFGCGQLIASTGLFLAGGYGAPRKTPAGGAQLVDGAVAGMYLHGIGALLAVIGGVLFVVTLTRALRRPAPARSAAGHTAAPLAG